MKKLFAILIILLLAVTVYAGIRPMGGVLELGRGGMQIVQTVVDAYDGESVIFNTDTMVTFNGDGVVTW